MKSRYIKKFIIKVPSNFISAINNYVEKQYPSVTRSQFLNDLLEFYVDYPDKFDISSDDILKYQMMKRPNTFSFYFLNNKYYERFNLLVKSSVRTENQQALLFIYTIHYLIIEKHLSNVYHGYKTFTRGNKPR